MGRHRTNGFTLVELLTVMVIALILIGLAIPAVERLMSSGGVSAASREVANTLGLARQFAITQRVYARVVFPYNATTSQPDMQYRAYAVITNRNNTVTTGWAYMTKWEYLPLGAVFLQTVPGGGLGALNDLNSISQGSIQGVFSGPLAYIEFGPTGAATALSTGSGSALAITEGFTTVASGIATPTPTATKTTTNTLANLTLISVDPLVGRIQVTR